MSDASPLVAEGIGRRYRRNRPWALRDVSIEIPARSITALVGPNGAGKSTLIRACLGFERLNEGRLLVNGIDPQADRTGAVASVGYVPQRGSLYRNLTIGDHMTMASVARPQFDRASAIAHLRSLGLGEERSVGELSGGEQAQVALALALGSRAPLLLLDEPLSSLDPLARRDFLAALIADVRGRDATAVLSSHIVTDVEQACDRIVVLAAGRVVLDDSVAAVKAEHRTVSADVAAGLDVVGRFGGPAGEPLALVRGAGGEASLEEIVLGYLASTRAAQLMESGVMLGSARLRLKQYRFEVGAAALAALLLGFAALIVTYRLSSIAMPAGCFEAWLVARGGDFSPACESATDLWSSINANEANFVFGAMLILPFFVGLVGGIPIVARELEAGTAQTAWSVTPSRTRWLTRQLLPVLALLGVATVFAAAAGSVLETTQSWSAVEHLILQGPIVVARALAAFGIGLLLGAVVGRTLPAFLIGMVVCAGLMWAADPPRISWLDARKVPVEHYANGYSFGFAWRAPDGTLTPLSEDSVTQLVPPGAVSGSVNEDQSGYEEWLYDHGYELVQLDIPDEVARGWIPIESVGMSLIGLGATGAATIAVNRRRPT